MNEPGRHYHFTIILPSLHRWKLFLNKVAINKNYGNLTYITNSMSKAYLLLYILKSLPLGSMLNHFYDNGSEIFYHSSVTKWLATGSMTGVLFHAETGMSLFCTMSRLPLQSIHWALEAFLFYVGVNSRICQCRNYRYVTLCLPSCIHLHSMVIDDLRVM